MVADYYYANGAVPENLAAAGFTSNVSPALVDDITVNNKNAVVTIIVAVAPHTGKSIIFVPSFDSNKKIIWKCASADIPSKVLPLECRNN